MLSEHFKNAFRQVWLFTVRKANDRKYCKLHWNCSLHWQVEFLHGVLAEGAKDREITKVDKMLEII